MSWPRITYKNCSGLLFFLYRLNEGAAHIIDYIALVIDASAGIQTQTSECLVLSEILKIKLFVILNKVDLFEDIERKENIDSITQKISKVLDKTLYKGSTIIPVSTKLPPESNYSISKVKKYIINYLHAPKRDHFGPFIFFVDHCFNLKGSGCVFTGTVMSGSIESSSSVDIPQLKCTKKIKSIQIFHESTNKITKGDRAAIAVGNFDASKFERGLICWPSFTLIFIKSFIGLVYPVAYYKHDITVTVKYHLTLAFKTSLCNLYFFESESSHLEYNNKSLYKYKELMNRTNNQPCLAMITLDSPIICSTNSDLFTFIGSKLDIDLSAKQCRLCFHGKLLEVIDNTFPQIYKYKQKQGIVEKILPDNRNIIVKSLFTKLTNLNDFFGFQVNLSSGDVGVIETSFGLSGKVKINVINGINDQTLHLFNDEKTQIKVHLNYKKFVELKSFANNNSTKKKIFQ